jgi:TRAP-type C4-dicarboxylate transport system substrate-binding protein
MKSKKLVMVLGCVFFIFVAGMVPLKLVYAQKTEINWSSFVPKEYPSVDVVVRGFMDRATQLAKGELVFKYRGGPETIAAFDQGKAVQKGIVDLSLVPIGFYEPLAPGIGAAMLTQISLEEERKPGGAYDYLNELHKKGGLFYLGRGLPVDEFFTLNLTKRLEKPKDFVGTRIGTLTATHACTTAWGATAVSLSMPEVYSAMERKLVDGVSCLPLWDVVTTGVYEVTKYSIDHGYYYNTVAVIMNLDKWKKIPKHLQDLIIKSMILSEKDTQVWAAEHKKKAREKMVKAGVEFYKLSPEVDKWFIETAYNAAWESQQKKFPEVTQKLRELFLKK